METRRLAAWLLIGALVFVGACGGGDTATTDTQAEAAATTTSMAAVSTTTSTTAAPATTTTSVAPTTTTTTLAALDAETVHAAFRSYFDLIAAGDYEGARNLATGSAAEYAVFTQHLDLLSPQPDWQFESASPAATGDAIVLDDGRYATGGTLVYADGASGSRLAVSNPVVSVVDDVPLLDDWGVDLGSDAGAAPPGFYQPPLSQRLNLLGFMDVDETSCFDQGMWAYVPGGIDLSETVRIISIGLACSPNGDLTPQIENSRLFTDDGAVDVTPSAFLMQDRRASAPMGTPTFYLAIFDVPAEMATADLKWETPFDRSNVPATTFHIWTIGPLDLD